MLPTQKTRGQPTQPEKPPRDIPCDQAGKQDSPHKTPQKPEKLNSNGSTIRIQTRTHRPK